MPSPPCMSDSWSLGVDVDQFVADGEEREFETRADAGLVEDVRQVTLHGLFADRELLGDVLVGAAFDDAGDDFELAWSEAVGLLLRHGRGLLHEVVQSGETVAVTGAAVNAAQALGRT